MRKLVAMSVVVALLAMSSLASAADVLITKNGKKYHAENCQLIKNKETNKVDEKQAVTDGYAPCSKCHKEHKNKQK